MHNTHVTIDDINYDSLLNVLTNVDISAMIRVFYYSIHANNYYSEICKDGVWAPGFGLSRSTTRSTTECAFAKWSQTNERDVRTAVAARIVWRFHRQASRANLHCGGTFRVGVGCIRIVIHRHFTSTPETSIHPVCVARGIRETNNRAEYFKRMICCLVRCSSNRLYFT